MLLEHWEAPDIDRGIQAVADVASCRALFNCVVRELALPGGWALYEWPADKAGLAISAQEKQGVPLLVTLPGGNGYFVLVDRQDAFGSQRYLSDIWAREPGQCWRRVDLLEFARGLVAAGADREGNAELLDQILASRDTLTEILCKAEATIADPLSDYVTSERTVWFGHPVHPAPKARLWVDLSDERCFAPEHGAGFRLHRWEVDAAGLHIRTSGMAVDTALAAVASQMGAAPGRAILSLHPVQAKLLLRDQRVRDRMARGQIRDLGATGKFARALASVRTLLVEGSDHLLKTSLAIRITNCVRKNAWYELESAVVVDRVIAGLIAADSEGCGGLSVIPEPASLGWSPMDANPDDAVWFREQTGVILRRDFRLDHSDEAALACTLFGRDTRLLPLAPAFAGTEPVAIRRWFASYARLLMRPVLTAFFRHGVVFEPHLQNCVVLKHDGLPSLVLLRDFEGVKLTDDVGIHLVDGAVPERVRGSLCYPRERGWQRIAYCLFVNNLSEAVLALTYEAPALAAELWTIVANELREIRADLDRDAPELDAVLAGKSIPAKANFLTRLAAAPDREARYVTLASPWSSER